MRQRGVSLLELVVALLIVGILLAVGIPVYRHHLASETVQTEADKLVSALKRLHNGAVSWQAVPELWADISIRPPGTLDGGGPTGDGPTPTPPPQGGHGGTGDSGGGGVSGTSGTGLAFILVSMVQGNPASIGTVRMDPAVSVNMVNVIAPDASTGDATALFYPSLNASVIFTPSGQLDPKHPGAVQIQLGNGPVASGIVQGTSRVEIDISRAGAVSSHALPATQ